MSSTTYLKKDEFEPKTGGNEPLMTKPIGRRTAHGDFESSLEGTQRVLLRGRNPALWLSQLHHICIVSVLMEPIIVFFLKFRKFHDIRYKTDIVFNKSFERKRKVATVNFDGNFESHLISFYQHYKN